MAHPILITNHARERWLMRVADPKRYQHLALCKGCPQCNSLIFDIRNIIKLMGRNIDIAIKSRFLKAQGHPYLDTQVIEEVKKSYHYPLDFHVHDDVVFVTTFHDGNPTPVLVTVLTTLMLEARKELDKEEINSMMRKWHFEARQKC